MSKMADMEQTIRDLRSMAENANNIADWLSKYFSSDETETQPKPELKLADVRAVLANLSRSGYTDGVLSLIKRYGADKLSAVKPDDYEALLKDAEELTNGC